MPYSNGDPKRDHNFDNHPDENSSLGRVLSPRMGCDNVAGEAQGQFNCTLSGLSCYLGFVTKKVLVKERAFGNALSYKEMMGSTI